VRPDDTLAPPQDTEAEQATLGAMLLAEDAGKRGLEIVGPADFYREAHRVIAEAIVACAGRGEPVELITVAAELRRSGRFEECGGAEYLTACLNKVPTAAHLPRYAQIVAEKSVLRSAMKIAHDAIGEAYAQPADPAAWVLSVAERFGVLYQSRAKAQVRPIAEHAEKFFEEWMALFSRGAEGTFVHTGIRSLDEKIGAGEGQRLWVILGGTKHGKSSFARQIALVTARAIRRAGSPKQVFVLSIEEAEEDYRAGCIAFLGLVNSMALTIPGWWQTLYGTSEAPEQRMFRAQEELKGLPLRLHFGPDEMGAVCALIEREAKEHDLACVIIDYFQRLKLKGVTKDFDRFSANAVTLYELGKRLKLPIIVPSQVTWLEDQKKFAPFGSGELEKQSTLTLLLARMRDPNTKEILDSGHIHCQVSRKTPSFGNVPVVAKLKYSMFLDEADAHLADERRLDAEACKPTPAEQWPGN